MTLAGFEATPAEEIPTSDGVTRTEPEPKRVRRPDLAPATGAQREEIAALLVSLRECEPETDWAAFCREQAGPLPDLTEGGAAILIRKLQERLGELAGGSARSTWEQ